MLALLRRHAGLRRLWLGEVVSLLGDWLTYVAVSILALEKGEGLLALAMVLVAHSLPNALVSPIAGYVVDRLDRSRVLVVDSAVRGVVMLAMAYAAAVGDLLWVQIFLVLKTGITAFHEPANQSVLARIVPAEDLMAANALLAATWSTMFAVGVALGGLFAAVLGATGALVADAISYFLAAAVLMGLPSVVPERSTERARAGVRSLVSEIGEAWAYARRRSALGRTVLGKAPAGLATGGAWVLLNELGNAGMIALSTAATVGLMHALRAVGTGIGPYAWMRTVEQRGTGTPHELTTLVVIIATLTFSFVRQPLWLGGMLLLWGVGGGANWVVTSTRIQRLAADEYRGRLSALDLFGFTLMLCFGAVIAAVLGERLGLATGVRITVGLSLIVTIAVRLRFLTDEPRLAAPRDAAG